MMGRGGPAEEWGAREASRVAAPISLDSVERIASDLRAWAPSILAADPTGGRMQHLTQALADLESHQLQLERDEYSHKCVVWKKGHRLHSGLTLMAAIKSSFLLKDEKNCTKY